MNINHTFTLIFPLFQKHLEVKFPDILLAPKGLVPYLVKINIASASTCNRNGAECNTENIFPVSRILQLYSRAFRRVK